MNNESYTGVQKAAILLITLGPEKAATIFKHLKEDEIEELTLEIANTRSVSPQTKEEVLEEFYQVCLAQQYIAEGGIGYAKELLEKALGNDKAQGVIAKLTASLQVRPFEFIRKTDPAQLLNFIQDEHPQTIAMILSYLAPAQASQVLGALPPEKQADVAKRIATMDRTSPDVIKEVERVLERKLASLVNQDYTIVGGIDAIVGILNSVDRGTEKHIMESLEIEEPELADEIRKKMFVFEDILLLDDRAIQRVLRDVENADLELALKNTTEEVQNVIYKNLSKRLAAMIKEDMDFMGPVRMKDVQNGWYIGHAIDEIYDYKWIGVWQLGEELEAAKYGKQPGDPRLLDVNNDGKINDEDKIWLGTKTPKHRMTLSSDLNLFKCINFSFVLRGEFGWMDIDNLPRNETNRFYNTSNSVWTEYWTPWNPNSKYARLGANVDSPGVNIYEKRNYVRMQNMALSYTFPKKLINKFMIDNLRFSINVDNAFVISKWRTSDPLTKAVTPRIWTFGVDITL